MLSRMISSKSRCTAGAISLRKTLPPSGKGRPVSRFHHSPRSRTFVNPDRLVGELTFVNDQARRGSPAFRTASKI